MAGSLAFGTKVVAPRRRSDALSRPRLLEALYRALERRALTITAPAGFGKTSLLADFAQQADMPVCWYALDPSDRDPRTLLTYLLTAIRRRFPAWGRRTEEALREADSSSDAITRVVASLVNEILEDIPDRFLLILDDCHALEGGAGALHALNTLLQHLPENCHVILSGRTIPDLPALRRLLAGRDLARLRAAELAFSDDEVRALLLDHYCLRLTPEQTAAIIAGCEGWAGGIALAALALEEGRLPAGPGAAGASDPEVFRYLVEEVLERQPERLQRFLLASSVLADLRPEVCAEALGFADAAACLHQIEERGLFISALEDGRAYRYHGMFVEFLRQQLRGRPDEWAALQTQAGRFFAAQGNWATAIAHFQEIADPAPLAEMLEQAAPDLYDRGEWHTLIEWLDLLAEPVRRKRLSLTLWRGKAALRVGRVDEALRLADQLLEAEDPGAARPESQVVHYAEALSLRAEALRAKGQTEDALLLSREAIRLLERRNGRAALLALAEAHHRIGSITAIYQARPRDGLEPLREALRRYEDIGSPYHSALVHNHLGVTFRNLGQFPQALAHYEEARGLSDQVQNPGLQASILNNIGNLYLSQRRYEDAQDVLQQALERSEAAGVPRITAYAAATLGDLARAVGHWETALQAYERGASAATQASERALHTSIVASQGLIYLHLNQAPRAAQLIEAAQELAVGAQGGRNRNFLDLTLGILYTRQGRHHEALNRLMAAAYSWRASEQREDWARASFHCAAAHYAAGDRSSAEAQLEEAARLCRDLGQDLLLLPEAHLASGLVEFAAGRGFGDGLYARLWRELGAFGSAAAAPAAPAGPPQVRAFALGRVEAFLDGNDEQRTHWTTQKTQELFYFLLSRPEWVHRDEIIAALWPDFGDARGAAVFRTTTYRLRKTVYNDCILRDESYYRINPGGSFWFDATEFERLVSEVQTRELTGAERQRYLEEALKLYRGPFMKGVDSEWCDDLRRKLEGYYLTAVMSLAAELLERQQFAAAAHTAHLALEVDAYHEEAVVLTMQALALLGEHMAAVEQYRSYAARLLAELDEEPSSRLKNLLKRIRSLGPLAAPTRAAL